MKTKHVLSIVSLVLIVLLGVYSCKKEQVSNNQPVSFAEKLSADESFMKLNNAINRFDPEYLKIVYKDARTPKEISDASIEILKKLAADPNNAAIQKELAVFYHFNSTAEFTMYSNNISEGLKELDTKFNFTKELTANNKSQDYVTARAFYARNEFNKLTLSGSGPHKYEVLTMDGLPDANDYTEQLIDYYRYSMNQGFVGDTDYGSDCLGEPCCEKRLICRNNAWKTFLINVAIYGGSGLGTAGAAGLKIGSILAPSTGPLAPIVTVGTGVVFGIFGGVGGSIIAWSMYQADLDNCEANYRLCKK